VSLLIVRTFVFSPVLFISCGLYGLLEFDEFKVLVSYENSG